MARKPAKMMSIELEDLEDAAFESDPRFMALIEARRANYRRAGGVPLAQVREQLRIGRHVHDEPTSYQSAVTDESTPSETTHAQENETPTN